MATRKIIEISVTTKITMAQWPCRMHISRKAQKMERQAWLGV
jgi:hypothetical protein